VIGLLAANVDYTLLADFNHPLAFQYFLSDLSI